MLCTSRNDSAPPHANFDLQLAALLGVVAVSRCRGPLLHILVVSLCEVPFNIKSYETCYDSHVANITTSYNTHARINCEWPWHQTLMLLMQNDLDARPS